METSFLISFYTCSPLSARRNVKISKNCMHLCIRIKAITLVTKGLYNKQKTPGEVWPLYLYGFLTHCQLSISTESDNLLPAVKRSVKLVRRFKIRVQNKTTVHTQVRTHVHTHTHIWLFSICLRAQASSRA